MEQRGFVSLTCKRLFGDGIQGANKEKYQNPGPNDLLMRILGQSKRMNFQGDE